MEDLQLPRTVGGSPKSRFTGKERDAESGNDYFGARYYSSSMGRFMSPDPLFITKARLVDPQQWNRYAYALNNPLGVVDRDGMDATIVYSYSKDLTAAQRKWLAGNQQQVFDAIRAKLNKAGIDKVSFVNAASLSKDQLASLAKAPTLSDARMTGTTGVARLEFAGEQASFVNQAAFGGREEFTDHGRVAVYLNQLIEMDAMGRDATAACDAACGVANVAAHGIGHAFGFDDPGHSMLNFFGITPQWPDPIRPDIMKQGMDPFSGPKEYRREPNLKAIEEVNKAKSFP